MEEISVTILTKNSELYLRDVLTALVQFPEVLVYDTGSIDATLTIARSFPNVSIHEGEFAGFGKTHNVASSLTKYSWVLVIDSDEVLTKEAAQELSTLSLQRGSVYSFPRKNFYRGKWIRWCGWHPDRCLRLYHREDTQFCDREVHEAVQTEGLEVVSLAGAICHYSYRDIADFLTKMQLYSDLFAKQNVGKKRSSFGKALSHGFYAFFKSYFLQRGFLGGVEGALISFYNGHTAFYKYLKLREANQSISGGADESVA